MIVRLTIIAALFTLAPMALAQEPAQPTAKVESQTSETQPPAAADANVVTGTEQAPTDTPAADTPSADATTAEDAAAKAAKLKDLLSLVQDNTLSVHKRENPAYFLLLKDVMDRTPEQLREEVTANPRFHDLYKKPSEYRGQLVTVKLNARRIMPVDVSPNNAAGVSRLYEIWGWTEEAKAWMYCCVVPELPEGFEEGNVSKRIELTGYFFKMQAYQPGNAAPNARNLVAPLVIGRIVDAGAPPAKVINSMGSWPMFLIIGFGIIVMFRLMLHLRGMGRNAPPIRRNYRRRSLEPIDPDALDDAIGSVDRGIRIRNANE